jgi:hypothetical protein
MGSITPWGCLPHQDEESNEVVQQLLHKESQGIQTE